MVVREEEIASLLNRGKALMRGVRWRRWLVWGIALVMVLPALIAAGADFLSAILGDMDDRVELSIHIEAIGILSLTFAGIMSVVMLYVIPPIDFLIDYLPKWLISRRRWRDTQATLTPLLAELGVLITPTPTPYVYQKLLRIGVTRSLGTGLFMALSARLAIGVFDVITGNITFQNGISLIEQKSFALVWSIGALFGYWMLKRGFGILLGDRTSKQYRQLVQHSLNADYEAAVATATALQSDPKSQTLDTSYFYCYTLYNAGRTAESETAFREFLLSLPTLDLELTPRMSLLFANVITRQKGATIEAEKLMWAALRNTPEAPGGYRELALYYLEYTPKPAHALVLSAGANYFALPPKEGGGIKRVIVRAYYAECLAVRAWALAANGRIAEADEVMSQALAVNLAWNKVAAASLQNIAGRIASIKGDRNAARAHYERAAQADPNGWEGQQARAALANLS